MPFLGLLQAFLHHKNDAFAAVCQISTVSVTWCFLTVTVGDLGKQGDLREAGRCFARRVLLFFLASVEMQKYAAHGKPGIPVVLVAQVQPSKKACANYFILFYVQFEQDCTLQILTQHANLQTVHVHIS
jgi:hypothetical protein